MLFTVLFCFSLQISEICGSTYTVTNDSLTIYWNIGQENIFCNYLMNNKMTSGSLHDKTPPYTINNLTPDQNYSIVLIYRNKPKEEIYFNTYNFKPEDVQCQIEESNILVSWHIPNNCTQLIKVSIDIIENGTSTKSTIGTKDIDPLETSINFYNTELLQINMTYHYIATVWVVCYSNHSKYEMATCTKPKTINTNDYSTKTTFNSNHTYIPYAIGETYQVYVDKRNSVNTIGETSTSVWNSPTEIDLDFSDTKSYSVVILVTLTAILMILTIVLLILFYYKSNGNLKTFIKTMNNTKQDDLTFLLKKFHKKLLFDIKDLEILNPIGVGQFGTVYFGYLSLNGNKRGVAIKKPSKFLMNQLI